MKRSVYVKITIDITGDKIFFIARAEKIFNKRNNNIYENRLPALFDNFYPVDYGRDVLGKRQSRRNQNSGQLIAGAVAFIENTPDIVSGAYYSYHLYRTLIVFKFKTPWFQMSTEAMQSVLIMEYMKHAMGKTDTKGIGVLLDFMKWS